MAASESVIGKKQFHYVDGEAVELSPDKKKYEEAMKQKMEFSKEVDRFIWLVLCYICMQVVRSFTTSVLKLFNDILYMNPDLYFSLPNRYLDVRFFLFL